MRVERFGRSARAAALALLFAAALHASPARAGSGADSARQARASEQLAALLAAADESDLDLIPMNGLNRGDLRRAAEFGDLISDAFLARSEAAAREQLKALRQIDRAALPAKERVAYDVFRYQTQITLRPYTDGLAQIQQRLPLDHVFGQHVIFAQTASGAGVAAYKTREDYENGLQRIAGFVVYLDRAVEQMRRGMASGHVQPRIVVEKMIRQLDTELDAGVEASPYLQPTRAFPDALPAADRERLTAAYRSAVTDAIVPALRRVRDFMRTHYLPKSRSGAPGLASLPGGAKLYRHALEQHTTTRMNVRTIHSLGVAEVARIRGEMEQVRRQVGFRGTLGEFFKHLQSDPRFKFATRDELLARYEAIRSRIDAVLPRYFSALPKGRFEIQPFPKEQEESGGGAYYVIGTPDGERPGTFFVNTSDLATRTSPRMTALLLHETVPGHHLQGSLAQEDTTLPALLRFGFNAGFGEGWGLYSEWLGSEMGLYDDPIQYFGRLDMEMIRAARLVVDTGLHAKGWSRARALRYMATHSSLDAGAIEQEIDRYIVWPGQATAYKVGELFIRKLRIKAQARLGARFDLREFHREVLDTGSILLTVLERKIDAWIDSRRR